MTENSTDKVIVLRGEPAARDERNFKINYAELLNPAQLAAVTHRDGPLLVVAGAGSGKTRTLIYRVARLIESGVPPGAILLLTFTRRAAQEMLRRVEASSRTSSAWIKLVSWYSSIMM